VKEITNVIVDIVQIIICVNLLAARHRMHLMISDAIVKPMEIVPLIHALQIHANQIVEVLQAFWRDAIAREILTACQVTVQVIALANPAATKPSLQVLPMI
jgi:hypothetical protein